MTTDPAQPQPSTSRRPSNIVLIGLMGSGKTTVGKLVAHSLGFSFIDTDEIIVKNAGKPIPDIFAAEGETGFRQHETAALQQLLNQLQQHAVIATGGGIVTRPENLPLLKQLGYVVWLYATPNTLHHRTAHSDDRPLLRNADPAGTLRNLLEARADLYKLASDLKITTDDLSAHDVAYGVSESVRVEFAKQSA
ncbi:shikimate kinase [Phragmitibacter flavus]|uniref:Shikimate kinase n=1 Tax=Phragmitibacter flavus TaxID=2576071 RepID=A0A5R8KD87_9BACT|nr:shikimate kinase [Phragmitibacter flavus]TLD70261.1 shikimate kinase [Phragmitibacter flavus]